MQKSISIPIIVQDLFPVKNCAIMWIFRTMPIEVALSTWIMYAKQPVGMWRST